MPPMFERNQVVNMVCKDSIILMQQQYSQHPRARSMTSRRSGAGMRERAIACYGSADCEEETAGRARAFSRIMT